ncbi:MAG TPA: DinB family protein [Longimicrobium sp.]|jgi:uncharacterized damage-inducible protein DinB|uniref:DinB family protein n=1 Tax=Longimicrobium sp. TaxID=2029185 RepID=UPI002EDAACA6
MTAPAVQISTLAAYVEHETERWRQWFAAAPPDVLDLPLGAGAEGTVRTLVKHIFAVELRYAQRLAGTPVSGYEALADETVDQLWRIHRTANSIRARWLADATPEALDAILVSDTRKLGRIESRAHTVVVHSLVHGIRHWAQIAMVLRQHGHGGLWEHDWLLNPAVQ